MLTQFISKYVRLRNIRKEMYASRVACCPLGSHVEYTLTGHTYSRTDGRQTVALRCTLDATSVKSMVHY